MIRVSFASETNLMAENEEEQKRLLMEVKGQGGKAGLKLSISNTRILASGLIISNKEANEKGKSGNSVGFHFLGFQIHFRQ